MQILIYGASGMVGQSDRSPAILQPAAHGAKGESAASDRMSGLGRRENPAK